MAENTTPYAGKPSTEMSEPITGSTTAAFKRRIERSKTERREFIYDWQASVDRRRAKPSPTDSDENRQRVPVDWSHTKTKVSALFSQVPRVIVSAENKEYKPAASVFGRRLNMRLRKGGIEATMFECLPDVINKAGIAAAMVRFECTKELKMVPVQAPDAGILGALTQALGINMNPTAPEMEEIEQIVDRRFVCERVSPDDLLWDADEFDGSDFDTSPWIGRSGRMTTTNAKREFKLTDEQVEKAKGNTRDGRDKPQNETEAAFTSSDEDIVCYDEIFYWRYLYHDDEKYFKAIQRMVFIDGLGHEPVINEPWDGQRFDEELGTYIGSCRFPIQVFTLNYMSDEPIPPSDSAIMRPQVDELEKSRWQMHLQRDHARPIRWANTDRVDADILTSIMQGEWGHVIPIQGDGSKALGEVAKSNYPRDNYDFDRVIKNDMMEATGVGQNQMGAMATGERSAAEAKITQGSYVTRTAQERARSVSFFLRVADVMAGLICLYDDFELPDIDEQEAQMLEMWDRTRINHELAFSTRGDASVLLDAGQRFDRLERFVNIAGKSGMFNPLNALREMAELTDIDPEDVQPLPQKGPDQPNVSFRFSGDDLANPIALAISSKLDIAPTKEDIMAAKMILAAAAATPMIDPQPPMDPNAPPPGPDPQVMADDRPDWQTVDRINSRRDASQNK
jgi:hypothetical protein